MFGDEKKSAMLTPEQLAQLPILIFAAEYAAKGQIVPTHLIPAVEAAVASFTSPLEQCDEGCCQRCA